MQTKEALLQIYDTNRTNYKRLKDELTAKKDEEMNVKLRPLAQDTLGSLMDLKKHYQELGMQSEEDKEKYAKDLKRSDELIEFWMRELGQLGSSISGIPNTTFDDIAGLEDVKKTAKDYLFALKNPEIAKAYNFNTNIGILLYGPPGCGKTLVAEAIANALGVRFFSITPSVVFGKYIGDSENNIRGIFAEIRACKNGAVLLVDECESIFGKRKDDSNRAEISVANQLLQEMNGVGDTEGGDKRVIIGATNRPWLMDEAYLRFKRFSLHFYIGMPNKEAIATVVKLNLKKLPCDPHLEYVITQYFQDREGKYTCADISGIIVQCATLAMQEYREKVASGVAFKKGEVVNVSTRHFEQVMAKFSRSVTEEDLVGYAKFQAERRS